MKYDFLIIGSGIAGLTAAILLSEKGSVAVLSKGKLLDCNTNLAQGGIAAVISSSDTFASHIKDTLTAGANHNGKQAVKALIKGGPEAIRFLRECGVSFAPMPHLEGGHSHARVWHTDDQTGHDVLQALLRACRKKPVITFFERHEAIKLIVKKGKCHGAFVRSEGAMSPPCLRGSIPPLAGGGGPRLQVMTAGTTILATGGFAGLYEKTTASKTAMGDGIALALEAGAQVSDLEFVQFHPTALDMPHKERYFLLSEALRGRGAVIVNEKGEDFLRKIHPHGSLAPRDVITRAMFIEQKKYSIYLDMRKMNKKIVHKEFPHISQKLRESGQNFSKDLIPITPVAHYTCGGVATNLNGATSIKNLYAIGEVACSGAQGANRLASNSLLEGVVFAQRLAKKMVKNDTPSDLRSETQFDPQPEPQSEAQSDPPPGSYSVPLKKIMWEKVGIIRTKKGLQEARHAIKEIPAKSLPIARQKRVCLAVIQACLKRPKSLGAHTIRND